MTDALSKVHEEYAEAHKRWRAAEIVAGSARAAMAIAEHARKIEWDKLVAAAATLPEDDARKEATRQFSQESQQ